MSWTLKNITEEQYKEIYAGTPAMDIIDLFKKEPKNDEDAILNFMPSKLWRLNSGIYKIENKQGELIPFEMNWAQHMVYAEYLRHPRLIILKSRQQGISTFWLVFFFDDMIIKDNHKFGLMAQGLKEAKNLKERIILAWDNYPEALKEFFGLKVEKQNTDEFALNKGSKIYIATSFRSGTLQGLHISEYGKIANKYPEKARETKTGSMQAIKAGLPVIIESTAEGSKNDFAKMWNSAVLLKEEGKKLSGKDFRPVFLSWVDDPTCINDIPQVLTKEAKEYFDLLEREYEKWFGKLPKLTNEKKWWWMAQFREFNFDRALIGQEYPGWPEEAFSATKDGSYYGKLFRQYIVKAKHIVKDLYDPNLPVYVAMDLGMNDTMVLVFFQVWKKELRIIDEYHNSGEGLEHYVNIMKAKPYRISKVYVPHDAKVKELGTGKSRYDILRSLGVNAKLLPKTRSVINDIELVRQAIPYMWFDEDNTDYLQQAMLNYSKQWDENLGKWKDKPLHDEWSNPADAIRYMVISQWNKLKIGVDTTLATKKTSRRSSYTNNADGLSL